MDNDSKDDISLDEFPMFLWNNKHKLNVELSNDKKQIKLWLFDKGYKPRYIFDSLFNVATQKATKTDDGNDVPPPQAILIFCQIKSEILSFITAINHVASENSFPLETYSDIILKIDAFTNWAIFELDTQLKDSQIETNRISISTNRYIAIFTGVAGAYYLHEFLGFIIPNLCFYDKNSVVNILTLISVCGFVVYMLSHKEGSKLQPPK